jgi:hypothetical protein
MPIHHSSEVRDHFDLDIRSFRERSHLDRRASRELGRKILRVDFIHPREIRKVGQKDCAFNYVAEGKLLILENGFNVFQDALRLRFDVALDQVTRGGVERDLACAEKQVADADRVIVRSDCGSGLCWFDNLFVRHKRDRLS